MKDIHPYFRKLAGVGAVVPVLLHQSRLSTAENERERDKENEIHSLNKRRVGAATETKLVLVESEEESLSAMRV